MTLSRYHRQMLLPGIGETGQERLGCSHALLVGCGALGCTAADLLVRAGVGTITIVDRDVVELTNLQRQSLYDERDVSEGLPKAEAARRRLGAVNAQVRIRAVVADFTPENAERIAAGESVGPGVEDDSGWVQVIIDGTDNFETRYLLNDLAVKHDIPYMYGGAVGTRGMQMTIPAGGRPCLRCLFEELPPPGSTPTCDTAGVLAPASTVVAACQAADALKILARGETIAPTLLDFDLWNAQRRRLDVSRMARADCPCCGSTDERRFEFLEGGALEGAAAPPRALCGRSSVQVTPQARMQQGARVDLAALAKRLSQHGRFTSNRFLLRGEFAAEHAEGSDTAGCLSLTVFSDGRAIVHGTTDPARARAVYAKYIGA
jgi:molybdopterin-synthase adenylyltransferase